MGNKPGAYTPIGEVMSTLHNVNSDNKVLWETMVLLTNVYSVQMSYIPPYAREAGSRLWMGIIVGQGPQTTQSNSFGPYALNNSASVPPAIPVHDRYSSFSYTEELKGIFSTGPQFQTKSLKQLITTLWLGLSQIIMVEAFYNPCWYNIWGKRFWHQFSVIYAFIANSFDNTFLFQRINILRPSPLIYPLNPPSGLTNNIVNTYTPHGQGPNSHTPTPLNNNADAVSELNPTGIDPTGIDGYYYSTYDYIIPLNTVMPLPRLSWQETSTYPVGPPQVQNGIGRQYVRPYPYEGGIYDPNYLSFINNIFREISNGAIETLNYSTITTVTSSSVPITAPPITAPPTTAPPITAPPLSSTVNVETLIDKYTGLLNNPGILEGETLKMYKEAFNNAPMAQNSALTVNQFLEQLQFPGTPNNVEPVKISYCLPSSLKTVNINPFKHQPPPNSGPIISNPIYNLVNFNYGQLVLIVDALEKRKTMFNNDKLTGYYQSGGVLYNNTYPSVYYGWPGPDNTLPVLNDIQFYGLSNTTPTQTIDVNNILDPGILDPVINTASNVYFYQNQIPNPMNNRTSDNSDSPDSYLFPSGVLAPDPPGPLQVVINNVAAGKPLVAKWAPPPGYDPNDQAGHPITPGTTVGDINIPAKINNDSYHKLNNLTFISSGWPESITIRPPFILSQTWVPSINTRVQAKLPGFIQQKELLTKMLESNAYNTAYDYQQYSKILKTLNKTIVESIVSTNTSVFNPLENIHHSVLKANLLSSYPLNGPSPTMIWSQNIDLGTFENNGQVDQIMGNCQYIEELARTVGSQPIENPAFNSPSKEYLKLNIDWPSQILALSGVEEGINPANIFPNMPSPNSSHAGVYY